MPEITVAPKIFKKFAVTLGDASTDDYAPAVASCKFTPSSSTQTWKGGTPDAVFTDITSPTWVCAMKIAQDWTNATSLVNYLFAHAGERVPATFVPVEGGPTVSATLILAAPEIGGDIDAWGETTVQHGVDGAPALTPAA